MTEISVFNPVLYSAEENQFLLQTLGQAPIVAMQSLPARLNPRAVRPILQRVYDLEELKAHTGAEWVGIEALKKSINVYLEQAEMWQRDRRRGAPRFPTMYQFDSRKRAHWSGPGSDSGMVSTYFTKTGKREPFAVELIPIEGQAWAPEWVTADELASGIITDNEKSRLECSVCSHTESFNPEKRSSYSAARARMSKHLRTAKDETERHREIHTAEFGSPRV